MIEHEPSAGARRTAACQDVQQSERLNTRSPDALPLSALALPEAKQQSGREGPAVAQLYRPTAAGTVQLHPPKGGRVYTAAVSDIKASSLLPRGSGRPAIRTLRDSRNRVPVCRR
jgi:hypothetical protein